MAARWTGLDRTKGVGTGARSSGEGRQQGSWRDAVWFLVLVCFV